MNTQNILLIVFIVLAIFSGLVLIIYNRLIKLRNYVKETESGIDVCLKQRFDLIPNIVETVKGYSKHEEDVFTDIAKLRTSYNTDSNIKTAENLNNDMNKLLAIAESYPELKANSQYISLQKTLSEIEERLVAARSIYNSAVTDFNNTIETIPSNFIANLFGFEQAELFNIEENIKENINIDLK